ncbi:Diphthine--ammonia ligase [Apiospora hydei]|uniref:Diphthine--ammonia ligase n=1 Tax=Apiospora hydei TaxID=1337664 RepID=A0ABR1X0H3_9PEZI
MDWNRPGHLQDPNTYMHAPTRQVPVGPDKQAGDNGLVCRFFSRFRFGLRFGSEMDVSTVLSMCKMLLLMYMLANTGRKSLSGRLQNLASTPILREEDQTDPRSTRAARRKALLFFPHSQRGQATGPGTKITKHVNKLEPKGPPNTTTIVLLSTARDHGGGRIPERHRPGIRHPGATERPISDAPAPLASSTDAGYGFSKHDSEGADETDLNSFMYQTVGHQVVPLYASATGLPLFRRAITGTTLDHGISYQDPVSSSSTPSSKTDDLGAPSTSDSGAVVADEKRDLGEDETESLIPLLRSVIAAHPEANAVCTGAILSTYQRTRVESVALRLGLCTTSVNQMTRSCSARWSPRGLEARIVKVASAGLEDDFLWENVASERSIQRVKRVLRKFGGGGRGSVLGEGGEFETLVVDGPSALFKGRIIVHEDDRKVVREGGGSLWLSIRKACVEMKPQGQSPNAQTAGESIVRTPALLDDRFEGILRTLHIDTQASGVVASSLPEQWCLLGSSQETSIKDQTSNLVDAVRQRLHDQSLPASAITNTIIMLRHMSDFPTINKLYGALFREPNPPARVTIASGDCLPEGCDIAIYLTVQPCLGRDDRRGLHVQSRSYWAPANIGPYSQAIAFPLGCPPSGPSHADHGAMKVTTIAGQIPLIPASMALPATSGALERRCKSTGGQVPWHTSRATPADTKRKTILAARAWDSAHIWGLATDASEDDDDEAGPDLWDRKFNPQYMSLTGGEDDAASPTLPDWDVLASSQLASEADNGGVADIVRSRRRHIPYVFAAEVGELPRVAGVEWHAHLGLAKVGPGSIRTFATAAWRDDGRRLELHHVVARSPSGGEIYVHTTAALSLEGDESDGVLPPSSLAFGPEIDAISAEVVAALKKLLVLPESSPSPLGLGARSAPPAAHPYLTYIDTSQVSSFFSEVRDATSSSSASAVIPCYSLWNARGAGLSIVALFHTHYRESVLE